MAEEEHCPRTVAEPCTEINSYSILLQWMTSLMELSAAALCCLCEQIFKTAEHDLRNITAGSSYS